MIKLEIINLKRGLFRKLVNYSLWYSFHHYYFGLNVMLRLEFGMERWDFMDSPFLPAAAASDKSGIRRIDNSVIEFEFAFELESDQYSQRREEGEEQGMADGHEWHE